jgi:hypothetical protein
MGAGMYMYSILGRMGAGMYMYSILGRMGAGMYWWLPNVWSPPAPPPGYHYTLPPPLLFLPGLKV